MAHYGRFQPPAQEGGFYRQDFRCNTAPLDQAAGNRTGHEFARVVLVTAERLEARY